MMNPFLVYSLLGVFVGCVSGLFGIGGGVIIVPALLYSFSLIDIPQDLGIQMATRTSLAIILFNGFFTSYFHNRHVPLLWHVIKEMAVSVIIGTIVGIFIFQYINPKLLKIIFMIYLVLVSLKIWFGHKVNTQQDEKQTSLVPNIIVGFIIGFKSAILGIGGGTISIPYLTWKRIPIANAVGISSALGFIIALFGCSVILLKSELINTLAPSMTYALIYIPAVLGVSITSIPMAKFASRYAYKMPQRQLQKLFAIILALVALRTIYKVFFS